MIPGPQRSVPLSPDANSAPERVLLDVGRGRSFSTPTPTATPAPTPAPPADEPPARPALFTAPPPRPAPKPPTGIYLSAPNVQQAYPLDCEAAALQVALAVKGINVTQQAIFNSLPQDPRPAVMSNGVPVQWGDPYAAFVGDVYGHEYNYTGYGVYYGPIGGAAASFGALVDAHTGWSVAAIQAQIRQGNAVVVWVNNTFAPSGVKWWTGFDGVAVPYTTKEHAVTVVGFDPGRGTITVVDVRNGTRRTLSNAAFAAALTTFGGMGVAVLGSSPPTPTPTPAPSPSPSPAPSPSPSPAPSPSPSASPSPKP